MQFARPDVTLLSREKTREEWLDKLSERGGAFRRHVEIKHPAPMHYQSSMWQRSVERKRFILPVEIEVSGGKMGRMIPGKVLKFLARDLFVFPDFAFAAFSPLFPHGPPCTIPHHSA